MRSTDPRSKVWKLQVPVSLEYAEMLVLYRDPPRDQVACSACEATNWHEPLVVEWDSGSDEIGDFTHARARIVTKAAVADELLQRFHGFTKGRIEMPDHPKLRRPQRITKRTPKRVWLPYSGPELVEFLVSREVPLLPGSSAIIDWVCQQCGRIMYKGFEGLEEKTIRSHVPRKEGKGLYFRGADLCGADFFRPRSTGLTLCTDGARRFMQERAYSNIEFLDVGDIVPA